MANRRDFIKISGLGLGGLAISASSLEPVHITPGG